MVRDALRTRFGLDGGRRRIGFAAIGSGADGRRTAADSDQLLAEIDEQRTRRLGDPRDR